MTTADWALAVSLCSFAVALAGFVWNVWSKFIFPKAKVRSYISIYLIIDGDGSAPLRNPLISIEHYFQRFSARTWGEKDA